jgi:outer membrane immunogenic protein
MRLKVLACAMAAGCLASPALAQQSLFSTQSAYDWSGFYVGALAGYGFSSEDFVLDDPQDPNTGSSDGAHSAGGPIGGFYLGYNQQVGSLVYGAEVSAALTHVSGANVRTIYPPDRLESSIRTVATLSARGGFALERLLVYGKAGVAVVNENIALIDGASARYAFGTSLIGGAAIGAGIEFAVTDTMTIGVDVTHIVLPSQTIALSCASCGFGDLAYSRSGSVTFATARIGWRF